MQTIKPVSRQLADYLASIGLFLTPKPNSVFAPLADALAEEAKKDFDEDISSEDFVLKVNDHFDDIRPNMFAKSFEDNSEPVLEEGVLYDELCIRAVDELKPIVLGILNGLKNIVNPGVNAIFETAFNCVSDQVEIGGVKLQVITNKNELALWTNAAFSQLVEGSIDDITAKQSVGGGLTFPDMEVADLLLRLKTGNELIDAEVADYLKEYNVSNLVEHTYSEIFNNENATRYPGQGQLPESVVALLLVRNMMADIPEGAYGLEEIPYQLELARVACFHATAIMRFMKETEVSKTSDRLIMSFPDQNSMYADDKAIVVCGRGYADFLEKGGSVDAIYGSYVGRRERGLHAILEAAPQLENQWLSHVNIAQSANLDDFQRKLCFELRRNIHQYAKDNNLTVDTDVVDCLFDDDFVIKPESAFMKTRGIIVDALWPKTEYNSVLKAVDAVCDKLQGIEFEEALELGIIEWLVQWALTHVNVNYVKP